MASFRCTCYIEQLSRINSQIDDVPERSSLHPTPCLHLPPGGDADLLWGLYFSSRHLQPPVGPPVAANVLLLEPLLQTLAGLEPAGNAPPALRKTRGDI